jgi:hypothetical protein
MRPNALTRKFLDVEFGGNEKRLLRTHNESRERWANDAKL